MSNFESLLSKNFEQEEIIKLKERQDYLEVKAEIEQMQANKMLDNLEWRINQEVLDKSYNLDERFQKFIDSIQANSKKPETITESFNKEEYISEQKTQLREKFLEKISWDETSDITDQKTLLWFGGLWALEQIENGEKIDKDSDFFDKIITWIKAKVGFFVLNFLWYWDDYKEFKHNSSNIKLPELNISKEPNQNKENTQDYKYRAIINIFSNIFDRNNIDRAKYWEVFANQEFMKLSLNELFEMKKNSYNNDTFNELVQKSGHDKKDVKSAISILTQWKWYTLIDNIYEKSNFTKENPWKNYRALPISEIFNYMGQDLNILDWMWNNTQLQSVANWIKPENINENTREYIKKKWISLHLLSIAQDWKSFEFNTNKEAIIKVIEDTYNKDSWKLKEEQEVVNNIVDYWLDIQKNLFWHNSPFELYSTTSLPKISKIFSENWLTLKEIIKFRVITWDKTNFEDMNWVQQAALYYEVAKILDTRKQYEISWVMLSTLLDVSLTWWINSSKKAINIIPQNVRNIISQTTWAAVNSWTEYLENLSLKIWWALKDNPVKWTLAAVSFIPFFTERYSIIDAATWK